EDDAPGIGRNRAAGDAEQRGLAGAVRPDDAERLALGEREVERARDHHGAEALGDFFEGEDGRHAVRLTCRELGAPPPPLAGEGWGGGGKRESCCLHTPLPPPTISVAAPAPLRPPNRTTPPDECTPT